MTSSQLLEKVLAKHLREHVARLYPGAKVMSIEPLGPDTGATSGIATKAAGYGLPVRMTIEDGDGRRELVWRVASANEFGHDRRIGRRRWCRRLMTSEKSRNTCALLIWV
jgi:hypothetical protein